MSRSLPTSDSRTSNRTAKNLLRFLVSGLLLLVLAIQLDLNRLWEIASSLRMGWLALMCCSMIAERLWAAYRWHVLIRNTSPDVSFGDVLRLTFATCFFGMFLPGGSIEMIRILGLGRQEQDYAMSFSSVVADRFFGLLSMVVLVLASLAIAGSTTNLAVGPAALTVLGAVVVGIILLFHQGTRQTLARLLRGCRLDRIERTLERVYDQLDRLRNSPQTIAWSMVLAFGIQILRVATVICGGIALQIALPTVLYFVYIPIVLFIQMLPISVAGLAREAALVMFLGQSGVESERAFALGMLIYFTSVLSALPGAWIGLSAFERGMPRATPSPSTPRPPTS